MTESLAARALARRLARLGGRVIAKALELEARALDGDAGASGAVEALLAAHEGRDWGVPPPWDEAVYTERAGAQRFTWACDDDGAAGTRDVEESHRRLPDQLASADPTSLRMIIYFPDGLDPTRDLARATRVALTHLELRYGWRGPTPLDSLPSLAGVTAPPELLPSLFARRVPSLRSLTVPCFQAGGSTLPETLVRIAPQLPGLRRLALWYPEGDASRTLEVAPLVEAVAASAWAASLETLDLWPLARVSVDVARLPSLRRLILGESEGGDEGLEVVRADGDRRQLLAWDVVTHGWYRHQR